MMKRRFISNLLSGAIAATVAGVATVEYSRRTKKSATTIEVQQPTSMLNNQITVSNKISNYNQAIINTQNADSIEQNTSFHFVFFYTVKRRTKKSS